MRITDVRTIPVFAEHRNINYLITKVETDKGIYGIGESAVTGKECATRGVIEHFRDVLIGEDPRRIDHLWQRMFRGSFFKAGPILGAAISAIDIALWDIKGKSYGVPVWELLGGKCRDGVICYPHVVGDSIESLLADVDRALGQSYKFVRFGIPGFEISGQRGLMGVLEPRQIVRTTIEVTQAVRDHVGPNVEICVDFHTRLDPNEAVRLCKGLEPLEIFFAEDPVRSERPDAYAYVRKHTHVPIAGGEELASKWEFQPLIEGDLIDYIRMDLCIVGGFTEARKIAGWAESHYQYLAPHSPMGPVSLAACVHLDIASPLVGVQELPEVPGAVSDVFPQQMTFEDGHLVAPTLPGIGVDIDEEAAADHPFQARPMNELRRRDGSVTNW
jgi:galactonate dehydratase